MVEIVDPDRVRDAGRRDLVGHLADHLEAHVLEHRQHVGISCRWFPAVMGLFQSSTTSGVLRTIYKFNRFKLSYKLEELMTIVFQKIKPVTV